MADPTPLTNPQETAEQAEVFAVYGTEPEVTAYAMARYSRSSLSMRQSLREIDGQKAEKFLNTFYFAYGHRSIADLAHISFAVEKLSILAAIEVVDETRWDGQERSTRYQPFHRTGWYTPPELTGEAREFYQTALTDLFQTYQKLTGVVLEQLKTQVPRPENLTPEAWERTLRARAFDATRYLLPLATNTSLGQIVSARALEQQIVRLLSSPWLELRRLGEALRRAASEPAYDLRQERAQGLLSELRAAAARGAISASLVEQAEALIQPVRTAPTLVKYTDPNPYQMQTRQELAALAGELMRGIEPDHRAGVDLLEDEPLEVEIAATLLYPHCHQSYRQIREAVGALDAARRSEILDLGQAHRGRYDELLREFQAGQCFRFDILMDIGAFRDLHRHRRCVQIHQGYTAQHGYDTPELIETCGAAEQYHAAISRLQAATARLPQDLAAYLLPLACGKRSLFKMDFAEAAYIAELRTGVGGHISYRTVAWQMYQAVAQRHPALVGRLRVTDPSLPIDMLRR